MVELDMPQMTIWLCFACWKTNSTDTNSVYVIFIVFPWKKWLGRCTSVLCYTYIACLVIDHFILVVFGQLFFYLNNI
jgi:hypothetical protein